MLRKSKTLVLLTVAAGIAVLGVTALMRNRPETAEEAARKMWRHFEPMKMEAAKDSNGVWWYRAATNTPQTSPKPLP